MLRLDTRREPNQLRSVRLRSAERDTLRARQGLERALAAVDWSLSELPPNALLLVRRLHAGPHALAAFGAQVSQALREQQRKAKRPWRDDGAATAEAVWFDEGELAACLVRDWLRGHVSQCWWWRTVLGRAAVDEWLREQVLDDGRQVATTLSRLAPDGDAAAWLSRLHEGDARRGLSALARDYQAPLALVSGHASQTADSGNRIDAAASEPRQASPRPHATTAAPRPDCVAGPAASTSRRGAARLLAAMPELRNEALRPTTTRLLAFALAAVREPGWLRSADFADAVAAWTQSRSVATPMKANPVPSGTTPLAKPQRRDPTRPTAISTTDTATVSFVQATEAATATAAQTGLEPSAASRPGLPQPPDAAPAARRSKRSPSAAAHIMQSRVRATGDTAATVHTTAAATDAHATETLAEIPVFDTAIAVEPAATDTALHSAFNLADGVRIDSDYGGLLYLLNAALALELYGDFTLPRARGLALSPWNWLALVGETWFGAALRRDPLWRLLADLAGRKPQLAPAHDFVAPLDWAIDAAWLQPWDELATVGYRAGPRRLRLWHPQGFVLADLPRSPASAPYAQAAAWCAERAALAGSRLVRLPRAPAPSPRQRNRRWLHYLLAYLEARLARALAADAADVPALVCRHRAQLHCNLVDVEVRLSLEALPLSLRLAGLDRDPGWIPAAGRSVRFRFA